MKLATFILLSFLFLGFMLVELGHANVEDKVTTGYYSDQKRGFWWYDDPKPEEKKEEAKVPEVAVQSPKKERRLPKLKDYPVEQLYKMHPDDFVALLNDFEKKAVMDPSEENLHDYYVVQDIARRKSLAFANTASYVWQKYPELTVNKDAPTTTPGRNAAMKLRTDDVDNKLIAERDDFGLIYFFSPT